MPRPTRLLSVSEDQQNQIERWLAAMGTPSQVALRGHIVLAAGRGKSESAIAAEFNVNRKTVRLWCGRFAAQGLAGLWEVAPGRGRKASYAVDQIQALIDATLQSKPENRKPWTCRLMAANQRMSKSTVNNFWRDHDIQPHRSQTFQRSRDLKFSQKLTDVLGLYLNPPDQVIVLCVNEKRQTRVLNHTQPGRPLKKRRRRGTANNDQRNRVTTLLAALDLLEGKVIGDRHKRQWQQKLVKFLRHIDREFSGSIQLHLVIDTYGTHSTTEIQAWLKQHPRYVLHSVPTGSSWLNLMERWFVAMTRTRVRPDSFLSVEDLTAAIEEFLSHWNPSPQPFVWTATVDSLLAKLARCRQSLEPIQPG